ncbi:MAG: hypothetical protein C4538_00210 [Nitrospiraceae bacterium]|nr:MAG: hypothetical protein C4538_00210 [Nitrospiraceae bacterium]
MMQALKYHKRGRGILFDQSGGVALVLVIWVIVVLIAIVGEFSYSMRTEINITRNFKEEEESYQLAIAGIEMAKTELLAQNDLSRMYMNADNVLVFDPDAEELPERKADLGKGSFEYIIMDEDGKLNLNTATPEQLRSIFQTAGLEIEDVDTIVDSIMDWRDTDDLHLLSGAEDDYYESLERPYSSKDGPFDSPDELLLVKGMKPEIFAGSGSDGEEGTGGVRQYFTVYGSGAVNMRTAPMEVIEALMGYDFALSIIEQRKTGGLTAPAEGGKTGSEFITILSTGYNSDHSVKRTVKITVKRTGNKLETVHWNDNIV